MRKLFALGLGTALAALSFAPLASAAVVTATFSGDFDLPYFGGESGTVSGVATWDTASADTSTPYQVGVIDSFTLNVTGFAPLFGAATTVLTKDTFAGSSGDITYEPDIANLGFDRFELIFKINTPQHEQISLGVAYDTGTLTDGYGLPTSLPPISSGSPYTYFTDIYSDVTIGTTTELSLSTPEVGAGAPEPASWALMLTGFGALGAALRGRRRSAVGASGSGC